MRTNKNEDELLLPSFNHIGVTPESEGKVIILRLNISPEEYAMQSNSVKRILYISEAEKQEVERYLQMDEMTKRMINAFITANNALYFNNGSDYETALWEVCGVLSNGLENNAQEAFEPLFIDKRTLSSAG